MVGWHHQLDAHEFEQALGVSDRQGSLVCCGPWDREESDTTERLHFHFQSFPATEDEMVEWHHQLNGHGFEWTPGAGDGQGGLVCCGSRGHKESDTIE